MSEFCQTGGRQCHLLLVSQIASLGSLCSGWVGGVGGLGLIIMSNLNLSWFGMSQYTLYG